MSFATPWTVAHHAPMSVRFPRQEYWSGLSFPSPGDLAKPGFELAPPAAAAAAKSLQSCPTVRPHRRQPTRLPHPWDSPGKNTGVGCHFLLQCKKVKSESEVDQSRPTLSNPMDCSPPGSSIHGIFQERALEWGAIAFSGNAPLVPPIFLKRSPILFFPISLHCLLKKPLISPCYSPLIPPK